jgi:hypothetical protein
MLALEKGDSMLGINALLASHVALRAEPLCGPKQLVPLPSQPLKLCDVRSHPLNQGRELLLGLAGILTSVCLLDSEVGQLSAGGDKLSHLPMSGSELPGQPLMQLRLFGEAVPNALLVMKEQGLLPAVNHEGLRGGYKLEAHGGEIEVKSIGVSYQIDWGNNVT